MDQFFSVGQAARELGAAPKDISDLFYKRDLDDSCAPIIGERRLIPRDYLPTIRRVLIRKGRVLGRTSDRSKCDTALTEGGRS